MIRVYLFMILFCKETSDFLLLLKIKYSDPIDSEDVPLISSLEVRAGWEVVLFWTGVLLISAYLLP